MSALGPHETAERVPEGVQRLIDSHRRAVVGQERLNRRATILHDHPGSMSQISLTIAVDNSH